MFKFKSFVDLEKEEKWLTSMAAQGWLLQKRGALGYSFFKAQPTELRYRIDYREFKNKGDYLDYLALFQDAGWMHVSGTRWSGSQYFVPEDGDVSKEIFSDSASKAARYRRFGNTWLTFFLLYFVFFMVMLMNGSINIHAMLNPSELFYTPGLWEKQGLDFLRAFLFEMPFAFGRGFFWLVFPLFLIMCLYYMIRAHLLAKKTVVQTDVSPT